MASFNFKKTLFVLTDLAMQNSAASLKKIPIKNVCFFLKNVKRGEGEGELRRCQGATALHAAS